LTERGLRERGGGESRKVEAMKQWSQRRNEVVNADDEVTRGKRHDIETRR